MQNDSCQVATIRMEVSTSDRSAHSRYLLYSIEGIFCVAACRTQYNKIFEILEDEKNKTSSFSSEHNILWMESINQPLKVSDDTIIKQIKGVERRFKKKTLAVRCYY